MKRIIFITFAYLLWSVVGSEIDCDQAENVNEDHIHYCCKHPDGQNEIVENCAKETGFKLKNALEKNILDINADRAMSASCFSDCILNKLKFLKDHKLNMLAVKQHFETEYSNDPEYGREMISAFDHCHGKTQENTSNFLHKHMHHHCNTSSSVILGCVVKQFFHNCPTNRWSITQECQDAWEFSKHCSDVFASL
ncbi:uncharacterized protein LOC117785891 [Drosophila innubila]|uniref:uncharacterized protein LOC117785891 n=1 Tax=Drosophila innubila TaxID=198719 RepID=UPI00148C3E10|nr:uncharacterized protein LOC117785891 [Drosophila innubila]